MTVESLVGGLIIGFLVSYFLLRFFDKIPTKNPILKSGNTKLHRPNHCHNPIEVPATFLTNTSDALRYFLIGEMFNVLRILVLGIVTGYLYKRPYKGFNPSVSASKSAQVE